MKKRIFKPFLPMNLQFFADKSEAGDNPANPDDPREGGDGQVDPQKPEITPEMQAIIDSVVGKEKAKLKAKYEEQSKAEITKAKELASLSEKERQEREEADRLKQLVDREKAVEMKEYAIEAKSQLTALGLAGESWLDLVLTDDPEKTSKRIKFVSEQVMKEATAIATKKLASKVPDGGTGGSAELSPGELAAKEANEKRKKTINGTDPWKN